MATSETLAAAQTLYSWKVNARRLNGSYDASALKKFHPTADLVEAERRAEQAFNAMHTR